MKKILCILLTFVLCANSVICVYADDHGGTGGTIGGGDHGGTGGNVGWEQLETVDPTIADQVVMKIFAPNLAGAIELVESYFKPDQMDDDTRNYIKDNAGDNVRTDGKYYYINNTYINNVNQKVQNRVHALNGYYLIDSIGDVSYNTFNNILKSYTNNSNFLDNASGQFYDTVCSFISSSSSIIIMRYDGWFTSYSLSKECPDNIYLYINNGWIKFFDSSTDSMVSKGFGKKFWFNPNNAQYYSPVTQYDFPYYCTTDSIGCLGSPIKVFYTIQDIRNYINQGSQPKYYTPKIPSNKTIKVPINFNNINPTLNLDFDVTGMDETQIQGKIDLAFQLWLDKLAEINVNPGGGSSGGGSGGGSGGDHGGTGGDLGNPTPTPNPDDGFTSGTYDILEKIYEWLVSFGEKHDIFAKKITDYIEANDGKLDQIIEAINALGNGKTETENNGCKYDFTALSDFMTKLWNESDKKFDNMVSLLEENNKYQQKLVTSLNEIKAILITQTVLELFQDRSSETANKAKDKFPTSIPWDVAMVVNAMAAEPQEIKLTIPVKISSLHIDEELVIDLTGEEWEKLAKTCRYLLSILFILFMVHLSRKMFYSGGDD